MVQCFRPAGAAGLRFLERGCLPGFAPRSPSKIPSPRRGRISREAPHPRVARWLAAQRPRSTRGYNPAPRRGAQDGRWRLPSSVTRWEAGTNTTGQNKDVNVFARAWEILSLRIELAVTVIQTENKGGNTTPFSPGGRRSPCAARGDEGRARSASLAGIIAMFLCKPTSSAVRGNVLESACGVTPSPARGEGRLPGRPGWRMPVAAPGHMMGRPGQRICASDVS